MTQIHDKPIRQFQVKVGLLLFVKWFVPLLTGWIFLWGLTVLILRAAVGMPREPLVWGAAALPFLVLAALWRARRAMPARSAIRALLDRSSGCGGLLMADEELTLGDWEMPSLQLPSVRWQAARPLTLLLAGALFLSLSFLVPQRFAALASGTPFEIGPEVKRLAEQIDLLKEEAILDPARAESLKEKLNQVKDEASGKDPAKTLEALDHLENVANKASEEAAQESLRKTEKLTKAETLAEALKEAGSSLDPKVLTRTMEELAKLMEQNLAENESLKRELDEKIQKECKECKEGKGTKLSKEDMKKLAAALRGSKKSIAKQLEKLHKAGLIDLEKLKQCDKCGECKGGKLAEFLKECNGKQCDGMTLEEMLRCCEMPGNGGLTRGRGDAPLTTGDESTKDGVKFKEEVLPPSDVAAIKESIVAGLSQEKPKEDKEGGPSKSGALSGAAAGGGSANAQIILPRHRKTVERFFDRPPKPAK